MKPDNTNKLELFNTLLQRIGVDAFIVPTNDPHFSEYVPSYYACREWISGFTGSAGTVIVTPQKTALFTDARYFLQAEEELNESDIILKKVGLPETETTEQFLANNLKANSVVGFDAMLFTVNDIATLKAKLPQFTFKGIDDPFTEIWKNRPNLSTNFAFILKKEYAGLGIDEKLALLRSKIGEDKTYVVLALDEIAWLLNIRGTDISYNPLVVAYAIVYPAKVELFISGTSRFSKEDMAILSEHDVSILPYTDFTTRLKNLPTTSNVITNPAKLSMALQQIILEKKYVTTEEKESCGTVTMLKSQKNKTEIEGFKKSMVADGLAMVNFLFWLNESIIKEEITEYIVAKKLYEFREKNSLFQGESFSSIVGYLENGAIVHYHVDKQKAKKIHPKGFLLVDSGGQYLTGTTDLTRTIPLSNPTDEEKTDYTLVLKGHIALACAKFTEGMRGAQLDMLARQPLLSHNMNYLHGTGHGVGHFLCVHEGPQNIRMNENPVLLKSGMILSNEPGVYKSGRYGIRIENLILVVEDKETEFGKFMRFETLTLCPIDTKPIDKSLLTEGEISWLNSYHKRVYQTLSPHVEDQQVKQWLSTATSPI